MSLNDPVNIYKKNYITNVIFRVDFKKMDLAQDPPEELQKTIREKFPIFHQIKKETFGFEIKGNNQFTTKLNETILWEFKSKEGNEKYNKVIIHPEYLSLEYENYTNFKDFQQDLKLVLDVFLGTYFVEGIKRLGSRYINQIVLGSGNPLEWNNLIHPSLFSIPSGFTTTSDILRSMHVLEVEEDDYLLRFQFGLYNSEYPNPIARKEFVLDYDCFIEQEIEPFEINKRAEECNDIIYKWFEKSIGEDLREIMGVKKNDQKFKI